MVQLDPKIEAQMADMRHRLTNHPPATPEVASDLDALTAEFLGMAHVLIHFLPEGREKSLAFTKLEELSFWSKAAVARNQAEPYTDFSDQGASGR